MRFFLAGFICPAILLLAACSSSEFPKARTLFVGLGAPLSNLDPRFATDAASQRINDLAYSALIRIGSDMQPTPELAESWALSDKKIVFKLKKGFVFHSGRPVTAEDVVYSILEFRRSSAITSALSSIETAQVTGTDEVTLSKLFFNQLTAVMMSEH
jgi:peptide/nickel transport system substrate-binding protein